MDQFETDLFSVVHSLGLSINERDLYCTHLDLCNASCIRYSLVKLLRLSGYDAGVCISHWQRNSWVPGGNIILYQGHVQLSVEKSSQFSLIHILANSLDVHIYFLSTIIGQLATVEFIEDFNR